MFPPGLPTLFKLLVFNGRVVDEPALGLGEMSAGVFA
jgi:hypothetical protein